MADRNRYADVARSHRELGDAHELAKRYRMAESNAAGAEELLAEGEKEMQEELQSARAEIEEIAEELRLAMVERDPNDEKNVIVEIRAGAGGDEAGLFAGDLYRMLTRYAERARLQDRAARAQRLAGRRLQGGHVRDQGRRRLQRLQVRGRRAPRAARAADRVAGPHPHVHRHRRRAARGRGGRGRDRPQRPADRRLPLVRGPAGSRSTPPTRRCASPTSRPAWWSRCRTRSRS